MAKKRDYRLWLGVALVLGIPLAALLVRGCQREQEEAEPLYTFPVTMILEDPNGKVERVEAWVIVKRGKADWPFEAVDWSREKPALEELGSDAHRVTRYPTSATFSNSKGDKGTPSAFKF